MIWGSVDVFLLSESNNDDGLNACAGGTRWLGKARPCEADAACVAQLRACGAVLAGKTNMHELGAGTSGINPHHGYVAARHPQESRLLTPIHNTLWAY